MKKIFLAVAAFGMAMLLVCPESTAQNRRTSSTTQNTGSSATTTATTNTATTPATTSGTTTSGGRRNSGTVSQPASTSTQTTQTATGTRQATTTSRQTTTTSQPSTKTTTTTTTAPGGRRNSTVTTTTKTTAPATATGTSTDTKQPIQPQQKPSNQPSAQQPAGNGGTTMRPGGSTTHQNGNGNVTKPNGKTPATGQPQNHKPAPKDNGHITNGGKNITPGYMPDAIKVKPPKQPEFHHNKPMRPKPFYNPGYHMYGTRINTLPKGHTVRYVNKVKYYYYNGIFYRSNNLSGYIITRPPKGYAFAGNSVPFIPFPVIIDPYRDQATRIAEASALARLYASYYPSYRPYDDSFYINNVLASSTYMYYQNDGSYYIENGGRFTVTDAPLGALTDRLPYDYEEIYLGNDLFYLVDNILYGVVCPEGVPYFEVFCVL